MKYRHLGKCGLQVSELSLGSWVTFHAQSGIDDAIEIMSAAYDAGVNFFDNAEGYAGGKSEEIMGATLKKLGWRRGSYLVSTKFYWGLHDGPNEKNTLNRKYLLEAIDGSLRRFGLDYVDLVYCHRPDPATPIEETMDALNDVVRAGKARYIGASSMFAWQFAKAQHTAERNGWAKFVSMQNYYNLAYREEEREMLPLCEAEGVALIPWSPLARGMLAGSRAQLGDKSTVRSETDGLDRVLYDQPS